MAWRGQSTLFRGQSNFNWEPKPQLDRPAFSRFRELKSWSRADHEKHLLNDFKIAARPRLTLEPSDDWEWLAIAQHHGLATRLLDWTTNPLVACFFAVEDLNCRTDSIVQVYNHGGKQSTFYANPFDIEDTVIFYPPHITSRITAQGGCFTAHTAERMSLLGESLSIVIPSDCRQVIRRQLYGLGISRATLFPDLDGIASNTNWLHSTSPIPSV